MVISVNKTISYLLSEFVYNLELKDIPTIVIEKTKLHILDTIGIMMGTYNFNDVSRVINVVKHMGGINESTVVGHNFKAPAPNAAMANATMAHSVDYDDTHLGSVIHQSCTAVPTALAVGEKVNATGKEILEAIIAGYEVNARLGLAAPAKFHGRGFHATSVIGIFGSSLIAGKLMGLSIDQLADALGLAGSMASGILQCIIEGTWVKPMHPGFASYNGILAALLAKEGSKGPTQVLEGRWGVFNAYLKGDNYDLNKATEGLGEKWETLNISIKPYPTCHATHSSIDAVRLIKEKYNIKPEDVKEITFYLPKLSIDLVVEPLKEKVRPSTTYGAKFSIPYTAIVALNKGWVGLWDFTEEAIRNPYVLKHTSKVKYAHNEIYDKYGEDSLPAKAKVVTVDGDAYEEEVIDHKGTPDNPLTKDEVITKFRDNIKFTKYRKIDGEIIDKILNIEKYNISEIIELL